MDDLCFACGKPATLTEEHIIPQAIGGQLKAYIYCASCNSTFGDGPDSEISKQFGWIGTLLNIKRERGSHQPYGVRDLNTGTDLLFEGTSLRRKNPIVKITLKDGDKLDSADITARSETELRSIVSGIQKRYELSDKGQIFKEEHPGPTFTKREILIDNALLRRAVSKIAYGFICTKLRHEVIFSSTFDALRQYITSGREPDLASANFAHTEFMTDYVRPLHKIHVSLNRNDGLVVGYVSIFGAYRFTVLMAEGYSSVLEWPDFDYTFDPVSKRQIEGNDLFQAKRLSKGDVLYPKQTKEHIEQELAKGHRVIGEYSKVCTFLGGEFD